MLIDPLTTTSVEHDGLLDDQPVAFCLVGHAFPCSASPRERGGWLVFGNGEQVAVVSDHLQEAQSPVEALGGLEYEPDPPIFTPRITVVADIRSGREAWFGAARRSRGGRSAADVLTLAVRDLEPGGCRADDDVSLRRLRGRDRRAVPRSPDR
jgi:hypothetical protein